MKMILPGQTIGIIGGGQLGRMMAIAAKQMGYRVAVLDPVQDSPCGQVADIEITAGYGNLDAAKRLAQISDVITYEFENVDRVVLAWLEEHAYLPQGSALISMTQDREFEKKAITSCGLTVAPYRIIKSEAELAAAVATLGLPAVLKTCLGGYDGKGQVVIKTNEDIQEAVHLLKNGKCILESWVTYEKEISVIVSRNPRGEMTAFPVCENEHIDNILFRTTVPATIAQEIAEKATTMAKNLAGTIEMVGTLAVEMFLTNSGELFINELAPRPHNSGHFSLDACETSQFEQHIRAVCGWPLAPVALLKPVVMVNILGEHMSAVLEKVPQLTDGKLHLYGKKEAKQKRKMGHINMLATSTGEAKRKIKQLRIWHEEAEETK